MMQVTSLSVNRCTTLIPITILFYEYTITIGLEVERFWATHKLSWASFLFYANRYITLFGHIPVMFEYFWIAWYPGKLAICNRIQLFHQVLSIVIQFITISLLMMRIYALYDRNRYILALLVIPPIIGAILICWALISQKSEESPPNVLFYVGCDVPLSQKYATKIAGIWASLVAYDTLIFGMTVYKTLRFHRLTGANLPMLVLRDGSIYYLATIAVTLATVLSHILTDKPLDRGFLSPFANVISSVLISRQMLNLRDPELINGTSDDTHYQTSYTRNLHLLSTVVDPATSSEWAIMETPRDPENHDHEIG